MISEVIFSKPQDVGSVSIVGIMGLQWTNKQNQVKTSKWQIAIDNNTGDEIVRGVGIW